LHRIFDLARQNSSFCRVVFFVRIQHWNGRYTESMIRRCAYSHERIRLLVFDLDGTLIDSARIWPTRSTPLEARTAALGNEQVAGLIGGRAAAC